MAVKRLNIKLPWELYEVLRREAAAMGTTVSGVVRSLIAGLTQPVKRRPRRKPQDDPLYAMRGSFDGPSDLAEKHDAYLYGRRREP